MTSRPDELLSLWERAAPKRPAARPLALLAGAGEPDAADLPVGVRNERLFLLRERTLGLTLACLAACPQCAAPAEFEFRAADVLTPGEPPAELAGSCDGFDLRFRPPTAGDLAHLGNGSGRELFARCVLDARKGDTPIPAEELHGGVVAWAAVRMAEADPNADIRLDLECPTCGQGWRASFDIAAYFWAELDHRACHLLAEVHLLASAYGWTESAILGLSPTRRRFYLDRVTG